MLLALFSILVENNELELRQIQKRVFAIFLRGGPCTTCSPVIFRNPKRRDMEAESIEVRSTLYSVEQYMFSFVFCILFLFIVVNVYIQFPSIVPNGLKHPIDRVNSDTHPYKSTKTGMILYINFIPSQH